MTSPLLTPLLSVLLPVLHAQAVPSAAPTAPPAPVEAAPAQPAPAQPAASLGAPVDGTPAEAPVPGVPAAAPGALPPPPPSVAQLRAVWAQQSPEDVLTEARLRIDTRDFPAADARLDFLVDATDAPVAWFERGRSLELQERYREALIAYDGALDRAEDPLLVRDVHYRQAIARNDLRHHADARAIARTLRRSEALDPAAIPVVDLELGVAEAGLGKRRGSRRITRALAELDARGDGFAWARSRARFALTRQLLDDSRDYPLTGNKRAARNLSRRAQAIAEAEAQVVAIARTGEPEYALAGILALGDAYIALHDDLIAAPPPRSLTEEQADIYRQQVAEKATILRDKAYRFYDEGVSFAVRMQWQGGVTERMKRRRDALALQTGS